MKYQHSLAILFLLAAGPAFATSCEDSFQKKGNPLTGTQYLASVTIKGLPTDSAITQMRAIGVAQGMDVINEEPKNGSLLLEDPKTSTHGPIPLLVSATQTDEGGRVEMTMKAKQFAFAKADAIKKAMCDMLVQLKPGKANPKLAAAAPVKPIKMLATVLASEFDQQDEIRNPDLVNRRYKGKVYQLKGWLDGVREYRGQHSVFFRKQGDHLASGQMISSAFDISVLCRMAPGQTSYALSLNKGDRIELTGTFDLFDDINNVVALKDCKPG
jgi:hypothetical protein